MKREVVSKGSLVTDISNTEQPLEPRQMGRLKIVAAIPAFNEEKYIGTVVLQTRQHVDEVIVFDDGSTDHTADVSRLAGATVIRHVTNKFLVGSLHYSLIIIQAL